MRLNYEEILTLRLALGDWIQQEEEGGTTSQDEIEEAEKLLQKLHREAMKRREKMTA